MTRITKGIMAQITAQYIDVGTRSQYHRYNAAARIRIIVAERGTWELYVSPSRVGRPVDDAVKAIIRETKVGKKILKKAARQAHAAKSGK